MRAIIAAMVLLGAAPLLAEEAAPDIIQQMAALRKKVPPPRDMGEAQGFVVTDVHGRVYTDIHLSAVGRRLMIRDERDLIVLMSYLKDTDAKIRWISATGIEHYLKAYPNGMSGSDIDDVGSPGHDKMVRRFAELIGRSIVGDTTALRRKAREKADAEQSLSGERPEE